VRAFQRDGQIFLSTEAGGEGRNLQFARTVVNYDLPWNPLRIEQRIGRVHRLGQEREVHVVNLWALDTVEAYLMELLDRKIHMFELVVGELDLILGPSMSVGPSRHDDGGLDPPTSGGAEGRAGAARGCTRSGPRPT